MAVVISRPGGRRASDISPAPTYEGVLSRYANVIENALEEENNARIEKLILDYQTGALPWDEFLTAFTNEIELTPEGTTRRVDLERTLFKLKEQNKVNEFNARRSELEARYADGGITATERYQIENELLSMLDKGTEDYNNQSNTVNKARTNALGEQVDKRRAQLLEQYSPTGITNQEKLAIVDELLRIPPEDTEIYRELVSERASVLTDIQAEKERAGSEDVQAARELYEAADFYEKQSAANYQAGGISGNEFDAQNLANWKEVQTSMQGLKSQVEGKTLGFVNSKVQELEQQVRDRQSGKVFDVNISDVGQPVKIQAVKSSDIIGGKNIGVVKPLITYDEKNDVFNLVDPRTGKSVFQAGTQSDAVNAARSMGIPGVIQVNTDRGLQQFVYDTNPDSTTYNDFLRVNPQTNTIEEAFAAIPTTAEQEESFRVRMDSDLLSKSLSGKDLSAAQKLGQSFNKFTSSIGSKASDLTKNVGQKITAGPANLMESTLSGLGASFKPRDSQVNLNSLGGSAAKLTNTLSGAKQSIQTGIQKGTSFLGSLNQKIKGFLSKPLFSK